MLVGAGPGGPGLLTVAAVEVLRGADVVLYDRLAGPAFRDYVRPGAELVDVGKRPGLSPVTQAEICRRLVEQARAGRTVVRVKGGDPFIFGRGWEEVAACVEAGVPVQVVPGVSSVLAAPEAGGVPLTHRGFPPVFTVVSGHEDPGKGPPAVDWELLGRMTGPLVVLMGVATFGTVAERLAAAGRDPETPVVAVEEATRPGQRVVPTTLVRAAADFAAAGVRSPAVVVVGDNAGLASRIAAAVLAPEIATAGRASRALAGWRVVVARSRTTPSALGRLLGAEGAEVVEIPVLALDAPADPGPLRKAVAAVTGSEVDVVVCVSATRVERFLDGLFAAGQDARALAGVELVAADSGAVRALRGAGLRPDVDLTAGDPLPGATGRGNAVVLTVEGAVEPLAARLRAAGWEVLRADVVAVRALAVSPADRAAAAAADVVAFASSGTARAYADTGVPVPPVVACVGPATAGAARAAGLTVDVLAGEHTLAGLVAALGAHAAERRRGTRDT